MSKKANSRIYQKLHLNKKIKNYIQIQLKCVLKVCFNNDELIPRAENIKTVHALEAKWGIRIYCQARILTVVTHREDKGKNTS